MSQPPAPPWPLGRAWIGQDPVKELLNRKIQILPKTTVKKLCQHYKFLLKVSAMFGSLFQNHQILGIPP
jgi:hypothetical protein